MFLKIVLIGRAVQKMVTTFVSLSGLRQRPEGGNIGWSRLASIIGLPCFFANARLSDDFEN
jgi:hypothetical protein